MQAGPSAEQSVTRSERRPQKKTAGKVKGFGSAARDETAHLLVPLQNPAEMAHSWIRGDQWRAAARQFIFVNFFAFSPI